MSTHAANSELDYADTLWKAADALRGHRGIAPEKMKSLIDLIANIGFKGDRNQARDTLGRVYEYFLGKFDQTEGKSGGECYTPGCIVRLVVEMLEPYCSFLAATRCSDG